MDAVTLREDPRTEGPPGSPPSLLLGRLRARAPRVVTRNSDAVLGGQLLLVTTGVIVTSTVALQHPTGTGWEAVLTTTCAMLGVLAVSLVLPWRRWPVRAALSLPAVAVLAMATLSARGEGLGTAYVGIYVLAFVYTGLFTPAGSAWWLLPVAVGSYVPAVGGWSPQVGVRMLVAAVVWLLVAELLAQLTASQRRALDALALAVRVDALTALDNRRGLTERLGTVQAGDVLVMCDLDHFKAVNDTQGHAAGDRVLAGFAGTLRAELRGADYAARYGGEEFLLVLTGADDRVVDVLDRLHERWARRHPALTFSTGYATHLPGHDVLDTISAADHALYRAKGAGRNRDHAAPARPPHPGPAPVPARPATGPWRATGGTLVEHHR
jgi:diguanylate cyclase (GGDEF)-like protein